MLGKNHLTLLLVLAAGAVIGENDIPVDPRNYL